MNTASQNNSGVSGPRPRAGDRVALRECGEKRPKPRDAGPAGFIEAMSHAVNGVSVVTTDGVAGRVGITVSSVTSVSAQPPLLLVCINRASPAAAAIAGNGSFCVNLLNRAQRDIAQTFSGHGPNRGAYRFSGRDWTRDDRGAWRLVDAAACFVCTLDSIAEVGTHTIFFGRVDTAHSGNTEPLLYSNRRYGQPRPLGADEHYENRS